MSVPHSIGSRKGLVPSDNKPLSELMLIQIYAALGNNGAKTQTDVQCIPLISGVGDRNAPPEKRHCVSTTITIRVHGVL